MAIYKKGTTQAQKIKSIIIIIVLVVLFSIPIYKIGKKLLSYTGFSKLPVLACAIKGHNITFDLRKFHSFESTEHLGGDQIPNQIIYEGTDDSYEFEETIRHEDGRYHINRWWVNKHTGIIDGHSSYKVRRGEKDGFKKSLTAETNWNGTCKVIK